MTWATALKTAIHAHSGAFEWGEMDCCQFANEYHRALTGADLAAEFDYDTKGEALRILAKHNGIEGLFLELLGQPSEPEPGSIVLVSMSDEGDLTAGGVYNGHFVWTVHPDIGLCRVPEERIVEAWRCPVA